MDEPNESTSVAWEAIAARLEAFAAAWQRGDEPRINDHLPPRAARGQVAASPADLPAGDRLRHLLLVELIKLDMDERGRAGLVRPLEAYVAEFPDLGPPDKPPLDLIHEELHLARCRGEPADLGLACHRFPGRAAEIQNWLPLVEASVTSSLAAYFGGSLAYMSPEQLEAFDATHARRLIHSCRKSRGMQPGSSRF